MPPSVRKLLARSVATADRSRTTVSFTRELPLTTKAVEFASERHSGQRREGDQAEFVIHPLEAASILERSRYPDYVVAAAVLHDVLEDTDTEAGELQERFGPEVTRLVELLSDDPAISDEEARRDDVRERVRKADGYASTIYGADKVSKARELRTMIVAGADRELVESKRRHYWQSLAMLEEAIPESRVTEMLRFELEALDVLPPQGPDAS